MIPKSGYRFSEKIMLQQFNGRVRLSGGDRDRDAEQLMTGGVAHIDAAARAFIPGADFDVEREQMRHLEGFLRLIEVASAKVVFHAAVTDDVEKILLHGASHAARGRLSTIMEKSLRTRL